MLETGSHNPEEKLVVYGSLRPGELNHFLLADVPGTWERCFIRGWMREYDGFKAFIGNPDGPEHPAWLFTSRALPEKWPELDEFEGDDYRRTVVRARVGKKRLVLAYIYEGKNLG